jgi:uncharacterized membrane protein
VDLPAGLVGTPWLLLAHLLYLPLLLVALLRAPWWRLREGEGQHLLLGAAVTALLLWSIRAGVSPGLNFHLLGASLLTLMLGWEFALIVLSLALLGITLYGRAAWEAYSLNALVTVAIPVLVSYRIFLAVDRRFPNYFAYVLICGFFGSGIALAAGGVGSVLVLWASGAYTLHYLLDNYVPYFPLLMFPEGFLNGGLAAILVGFKPHWVRTFRDERYIHGK